MSTPACLHRPARTRRPVWEPPRRSRRLTGDEGGFAMLWMSLLLVVLIGFSGFAIDVSNWWVTAGKLQRAADAAALSGVVWLPPNPTNAVSTARTVAGQNGYPNVAPNSVSAAQDPTRANRLQVSVTTTVNNYFASVLGFRQTTITRSAEAEFEDEVTMGSPSNYLGNDPEPGGVRPNFWLNIFGAYTTKIGGDRFMTQRCGGTVYNCTTTNTERDIDGYYFAVEVNPAAAGTGPLVIEGYDLGYQTVGDYCEQTALFPTAAERTALDTQWAASGLASASLSVPSVRYASGIASVYCSGDWRGDGANIITSFIVRSPDSSPWDPSNNPVVCSRQFPAYDNAFYGRLNGQLTAANWNDPSTFVGWFRKWATICSIGTVEEGQYFVQVRTNAASGAPTTATSATDPWGGRNRYSLRATLAGSSNNVALFAKGRLPVYTNVPATGGDVEATFYLARVLPSSVSGRLLNLEFFDIGDTNTGDVDLYLAPPAGNAAFSGCTYQVLRNGTLASGNSCQLLNMAGGNYNGSVVRMQIPIPVSYSCNTDDPFDCWVRVRLVFQNGAQPVDTTTWGASITGDPVRLVR